MKTELLLKISTDEKYEFFQKYDRLGDLQQEIWVKVTDYCNAYPTAFPKQATIAKELECSRKHVNRTFKKFTEYGWLKLESRGARRTKILVVRESLLQIDINNRKYFKRVEVTRGSGGKVTSGGSHNYSNNKKETSRETGEIALPHYLEKLDIPLDAKLKLNLLPEKIFVETLYQCKKKAEMGIEIKNTVGYFVGTAINIAKNNGIYINWPSYFRQRDRMRL